VPPGLSTVDGNSLWVGVNRESAAFQDKKHRRRLYARFPSMECRHQVIAAENCMPGSVVSTSTHAQTKAHKRAPQAAKYPLTTFVQDQL